MFRVVVSRDVLGGGGRRAVLWGWVVIRAVVCGGVMFRALVSGGVVSRAMVCGLWYASLCCWPLWCGSVGLWVKTPPIPSLPPHPTPTLGQPLKVRPRVCFRQVNF